MYRSIAAAALGLALFGTTASATPILYPDQGEENPIVYTFTASSTGDIVAYFYGAHARYTNTLGLLINGISTGIEGLNNQTSSYGQSLNFGHANAGDTLIFQLNILNPGNVGPWYSDASMNSDELNHIYSTDFAGDTIIPAGTFVGFEDLRNGGDFDYDDEQFVFTNIATSIDVTVSERVPEPGSLALLALGLGAMRLTGRRKQPAKQ